MEYLYWMLFGEIFIFFLAYISSGKDILSPSVIAIFMFIISTFGIIYNADYWDVSYSAETAKIVCLTLLMMYMTELFVIKTTRGCKRIIIQQEPMELAVTKIEIPTTINLMIVVALFFFALYYIYAVFRSGSVLGAVGLLAIGTTKYSEEGIDLVSRLGFRVINIFFFIYAYILINNIVVCKQKVKDNVVNLLPILCGFLMMFFAGSRKLLVQYPMAIILMYAIRKRDTSGWSSLSTKKLVKRVIPICTLILVVFYAMREISKGSTALADRTFLDYLTYYISSPLYLLDKYITSPQSITPKAQYFGQYTFLGFYNSLISWGLLDFKVPSNKFVIISSQAYMSGNEFTWIQRPYQDFGIVGTLIFTFIVFYIYNRVYYKKILCRKNGQKRDITLILYSYFYFIVVLSFYCVYTITEVSIQSVFYSIILVIMYRLFVSRKQRNNLE